MEKYVTIWNKALRKFFPKKKKMNVKWHKITFQITKINEKFNEEIYF